MTSFLYSRPRVRRRLSESRQCCAVVECHCKCHALVLHVERGYEVHRGTDVDSFESGRRHDASGVFLTRSRSRPVLRTLHHMLGGCKVEIPWRARASALTSLLHRRPLRRL